MAFRDNHIEEFNDKKSATIAEVANLYERAGDALSRLEEIALWGLDDPTTSITPPRKLAVGWEAHMKGYTVIAGELRKMIEERWDDLVREAGTRIRRRAEDAVIATRKVILP